VSVGDWLVDETLPFVGPAKPFQCVDGYASHEWAMAIEEGRVVLSTDCNLCDSGMADWSADDDTVFEMAPMPVAVEVMSSPGNPPYGIDPCVWVQISAVEHKAVGL
jgi:hypothetical protein